MLSNEMIVWLLFRFVDLLIIIGLAIYGIRRFALPLIKKEIDQEQQEKKELKHLIEQLHEQAGLLNEQLKHDTERIAKLEHHMMVWQETIKRQQKKRQAQKEDIKAHLAKTYAQRIAGIERELVYDKVVPQAFKQAEKKLVQHYDAERNQAYVQDVLALMDKECR